MVTSKSRFGLAALVLTLACLFCSIVLLSENAYAADTNEVSPKGTIQFQVTGTNDQTEARKILALVNKARTNAGVKTQLTWDYNLEKAAIQRAAEISIYFEHYRPDGSSCFSSVSSGTYYSQGENIHADQGASTAATANDGWTKSQGHYENMINTKFTCMGAANFKIDGVTYWVELFGNPNQGTAVTTAVQGSHTYTISATPNYLDLSVTIPQSLNVSKTAQCKVTNKNKGVDTFVVTTTINPNSFSWTSSNTGVISISNSGLMSSKAAGTSSVKVKLNDASTFGSNVTVTNTGSSSTTVKAGWQKSGSRWWYRYSDNSYAKGLTTIGTTKYYFDNSGYMKTGWQHATGGSDWYYFNASGAMVKGWAKISGKWYYMDNEGVMQKGFSKIGSATYYLDATNGDMKTGWRKISNKWYYFTGSGVMQTSWTKVSGKWYYMNNDGIMQTGRLTTSSGAEYYLDAVNGNMKTGWQRISNKWYYYAGSGVMQKNKWVGNYWVGSDGVMATSTWVDNDRYYVNSQGKWVKGMKK